MTEKKEEYKTETDYEKEVKEFLEDSRKAKNIVAKVKLDHMDFYSSVMKQHLGVKKDNVEDIRQTDLGKLKETEHSDKVADAYIDKCKEGFLEYMTKSKDKSKKDKLAEELNLSDKFNEVLATKHLYGVTRASLKRTIAAEKDNFTPEKFMKEYVPDFMKVFEHDIGAAAGHHLTDKHIDALLKHAVHEDTAKKIRKYVNVDVAKAIIGHYRGRKLTQSDLLDVHKLYTGQGLMDILPPHLETEFEKTIKKVKKAAEGKLGKKKK